MLFTSRSTPTVFVEKESSLQQAVMALLGWILVVPFLMPGTDTTLLVMSNGGNQTTAQHGDEKHQLVRALCGVVTSVHEKIPLELCSVL